MKKIISFLCAILCVLSLTACSISNEKPIAKEDKVSMEQTALSIIQQCQSTDKATYEQILDIRNPELDAMLISYGIPCEAENFKKILTSWRDGVEEVGDLDLTSIDDFTYSQKNNEIIVSSDAKFSKRSAKIDFTFKPDGTLTSVTIGAKYSTGEILKKSGLNTIIGMGTTFTVLIFIALIISLFKFIGGGNRAKGDENAAPAKAAPAPAAAPAAPAKTDDTELIAVISAAIAAAEGGNPGRIKSIVRRGASGRNGWQADQNFDHVEGFAARSIRRSSSDSWKRS